MRRLITVYRSRIGLREHPKYYIVRVLDFAKSHEKNEPRMNTDETRIKTEEQTAQERARAPADSAAAS
jgi:hypothetical protein